MPDDPGTDGLKRECEGRASRGRRARRTTRTTVHAPYVTNLEDEDYADVHVDGVVEDLEPDGRVAIQEAKLIDRETDVVAEVEGGDAARNILGHAERNEVDPIVTGARGRSGIARTVMGTVSGGVVRLSGVPVVVVPAEREGKAPGAST